MRRRRHPWAGITGTHRARVVLHAARTRRRRFAAGGYISRPTLTGRENGPEAFYPGPGPFGGVSAAVAAQAAHQFGLAQPSARDLLRS